MANFIVNGKKLEIECARLLTADEFIRLDSAIPDMR